MVKDGDEEFISMVLDESGTVSNIDAKEVLDGVETDAWVIAQLFGPTPAFARHHGRLAAHERLAHAEAQPAIDPDRAQWPEWVRALRGTQPLTRDAEYL